MTTRLNLGLTLGFLALFSLSPCAADRDGPSITLASTTSTENSGLLARLIPEFEADTGVAVRVVAVGTGQAIRIARNGDADVLLVHHRKSEEAFVADGFGVKRVPLMYNDFIVVGPASDPANIGGDTDVIRSLEKILVTRSTFVSRGDDSGTHKKELELWKMAGIDPRKTDGGWYRETGAGMGATLNVASGMDAYALTDRSTWMKFGNKGNLGLLVEGDPPLFNRYSVILVNPIVHRHVHAAEGQMLIDWLVSEKGQRMIADYRIEGAQAFFPDAADSRQDERSLEPAS